MGQPAEEASDSRRERRQRVLKRATILTGINRDHMISRRRQREVVDEHRGLIAALSAHDEDRAAALIVQHVRGAGRHITDRLRSERNSPEIGG